MELEALLEAFAALGLGWKGLVFVGVILGGVFAAKKGNLVATGDQARLANVVFAFVMAALTGDVQEGAILGSLSSIVSALLFELVDYFSGKLSKKPAA